MWNILGYLRYKILLFLFFSGFYGYFFLQKRTLDPLELELQVVTHYMGARE